MRLDLRIALSLLKLLRDSLSLRLKRLHLLGYIRISRDFQLAHLQKRLLIELLSHDLCGDADQITRYADQFTLLVTNADGAELRLDLLRCRRLVLVGRSTHDVGDADDLVDVVDDLIAETDKRCDDAGNDLYRPIVDRFSTSRELSPILDRDQDIMIIERANGCFDSIPNLAASWVEALGLDGLAELMNAVG
ncbi:hypothetical protein D9M72_479030 [compost metagenome]